LIGERAWKEIKEEVCGSEEYKSSQWYLELHKNQQEMAQTLRKIQLDIGLSEPL